MDICVSDRSFFPQSAIKKSKEIAKLAKSIGYKQVEFHPTWAVCWEWYKNKRLSCRSEDISSWHIDWRQDRIQAGAPLLKRITHKPSMLFPPTNIATKVLQQLEKKYHKPVVIHWPQNIGQYQYPILELHDHLSLGSSQLTKYLNSGKLDGLLIDTYKLDGWLAKYNWLRRKKEFIRHFINNIKEVHFRFKSKSDFDCLNRHKPTHSVNNMIMLVKLGYQGRVVVETGWPDSLTVAGCVSINIAQAQKIHQPIINFITGLEA